MNTQDIDKKLQELAVMDFRQFLELANIDRVQVFCQLERKKGRSYQQIANKLGISRQAVAQRLKRCKQSA